MLQHFFVAALCLLLTFLYVKVHYKRFKQYANLPQLPSSLLFGHLKTFSDFTKRGHTDRHPDFVFSEMREALGRPPIMFVDVRPLSRPLVIVSSHEVAEQITKPSRMFPMSLPKASFKYLEHAIGPTSILTVHGNEWKALRKRFNPGFAPQHLLTILPCIVEKTARLTDNLDELVHKGNEISLVPLFANLTFDIIGAVLMDVDLEAQHLDPSSQGELIKLYQTLLKSYAEDTNLPWWIIPCTALKRRRLGKRINVLIEHVIRLRHAEVTAHQADNNTSRSILSLSLADKKDLSPELVRSTCDQIKTFLLAGHDTTSNMLAWVLYEMWRTPRTLISVRAELDDLFGTNADPEAIRAKLLSPKGPQLLQQMTYISAVIKEALRLHPPAETARYVDKGSSFYVRTSAGEEYCLGGVIIYNCESAIQRDPDVFGDLANEFVPERWLGNNSSSVQEGGVKSKMDLEFADIPASAWRPFERGPRNCIGQTLATLEARVIIALLARRYDFSKVGLGAIDLDDQGQPVLDEIGQGKVKSPLYTKRQVTAKPVDGMRMMVKMNGTA